MTGTYARQIALEAAIKAVENARMNFSDPNIQGSELIQVLESMTAIVRELREARAS